MNKRQIKKFKKKRWNKTYRRFRNRELVARISEAMIECIKEYKVITENFIRASGVPREMLMGTTIKEYGGIVYEQETEKEIQKEV